MIPKRVSKEIQKERIDICKSCSEYISFTGQCKICMCFMTFKSKWEVNTCPKNKWPNEASYSAVRELLYQEKS